MKHVSILSSLATSLSFSRAAPAISNPGASAAPISSQCINIEYRQNWIVAECLTGEDATTRIKSAVYLHNKIENSDGSLKWNAGGGYARTCADCQITGADAALSCSCGTSWNTGKPPNIIGTIKLDEHISVYNGHLLSNFPSTPAIPPISSKYAVPDDLSYSFGGLATCPEAGNESYDFCKMTTNSCHTSTNTSDTLDSRFFFTGPLTCYVPTIYFPAHFQFEALKLVSQGAWEVLGYRDETCSGEAIERVGPEDVGVCKKFGDQRVRALTIRPAFNGDPQ
ncbi:hypothetical protein K505DRAFT_274883 [Melanomma pulvis-pyrius CBS 109.77]|uniref:Cyanovirin-N domain-containing protein n=1 Tax=Melanomma pulvis-pyrius CBS 109.77 TaxID=1314802 RepID=A0A6A6XFZ5_9PLEO|nr:hypothetical protein K505DRAFT_274883 [Melanomma pulvis-pyrius CBS 109.77]